MDGGGGGCWRVERQITSFSQESRTRVFERQYSRSYRVGKSEKEELVRQLKLGSPSILGTTMEGMQDGQEAKLSPAEMLRLKMERMKMESGASMEMFKEMNFKGFAEMGNATTTTTTSTGRLGQSFEGIDQFMSGASLLKSNGFNMAASMRSQRAQMFAATRSATVQSATSTVSGSSNSGAWVSVDGEKLKETVESSSVVASASNVSSSSSVTATAKSVGLVDMKGMTRSFSSAAGYPMPGQKATSQNGLSRIPDSPEDVDEIKDGSIPSLQNFVSPFRRPFGFRNYDRPLWNDLADNFKDSYRMTWDPLLHQSIKSSTSQVQFSASQRTVFQNINGEVRTFQDQNQKLIMRQSYGASESESEDDDDDDLRMLTFEIRKGLPYQPKLAISDKPEYPPSESYCTDDTSSLSTISQDNDRDSIISDRTVISPPTTPEHKRCHKVAQELLTTERTYVRILHLIDQMFHFRVDQENRAQQMFPPETVTQMFCNIKSLYMLHNDHLLPQLEKRLGGWEEDNPRIGDIMKNFAPFLKMYSEYVQNFDNSINLINLYKEKNARFAKIINEIQKTEACANLPIQHHLIGPIQRIPRYRLLLEAYLRKLPEDSIDRPDTEEALEIVSKAATHANEAMRRIAHFKKLLEVQEQVKGAVDLVSPTRVLLKEGKISKISARSSDHQERYIFLFSDILLLCSMRPMANRMISSSPYQLRAKLDVAEMTVNEGDDLEVVNTFYIQDHNKRIELYTATAEEKKSWMEVMWQARIDLMERKSSLRLGSISPTEEDLGIKQPAKIKSDSVSKCMECHTSFTMLKRRHHCHACGSVVCAKCSGAKVPLPYAGGKSCRVCKTCKSVLEDRSSDKKTDNNSSSCSSPDDTMNRVQGVLDVPASAPAVTSGNLNLKLRGKKEWTPRWLALRSDFVLYCYAKDTDKHAMTATPLPGINVAMADTLPKSETSSLSSSERDRTFRAAHETGRKSYFFMAGSREEALQWVHVLQLASKAELETSESNGKDGQ